MTDLASAGFVISGNDRSQPCPWFDSATGHQNFQGPARLLTCGAFAFG